ncbi:MAG: hypothetical protein ACRD9Y_25590, partial [Blastocatellia bacterium]
LRGVRETMLSRPTEEKFDWGKTWVAEMFLSEDEQRRRRDVTPEEARLKEEEKRINEIKGGLITTFVGIGIMIFLLFLFADLPVDHSSDDDEIQRNLWMAGIIPFLIGIAIMFNGFFISRRLVKLKEQQAQAALSASPTPVAIPARTTDQLIVEAAPASGFSVTENTTAHLPQPVPAPRREPD